MENAFDSRHEAFARYLNTSPQIVDEAFEKKRVLLSADRHELSEAKLDCEALANMEFGLRKALNASRTLSDTQKIAFKLQGLPSFSILSDFHEGVKCALTNREAFAETNTVRGRGNTAVTAIAQAIGAIFDELNRDVKFGTNATNNEPSTTFAKAVKEAIKIYDIQNVDGTPADWRAAARAEHQRRRDDRS